MEQELIYHYTSLDSFYGMLRTFRDSNKSEGHKYLELWASSIYLLNDPYEMLAASSIIIDILRLIEDEKKIDENIKLSCTFSDIESIKMHYFHFLEKFKYIFTVSLSHNRDTLPMWSMYAKDGKGICIAFKYEMLKKYFEDNEDLNSEILPVFYDKNEMNSSIYNKLSKIYDNYKEEMLDNSIIDKEDVIRCFQINFLLELAPFYKDSAYSYEQEERLICRQQRHDETIDFKISSNGYIIPYRKIKIPVEALTQIIIGPSYDFELLKQGINYQRILSGIKCIDIIPSIVNYRKL